MNQFDLIHPGMKVELQTVSRARNNDDIEIRKCYQSSIYDVHEDGSIDIYMPTQKGKMILLSQGAKFDIYFYVPGTMYKSTVTITDRFKNNNIYLVKLELTSEIKKNQRRQYYRLECALELRFRKLTVEEAAMIVHEKPFVMDETVEFEKSVLVDISGGGLRFLSPLRYSVGDFIINQFTLNTEYTAIGRILNARPVENRINVFEYRVEFINLDNKTREAIVRFIFEKERQMRQLKQKMN